MKDPKASRRKYLSQLEYKKMILRYKDECGECITRKATKEEIDFSKKMRERKLKYPHRLHI